MRDSRHGEEPAQPGGRSLIAGYQEKLLTRVPMVVVQSKGLGNN